MKIRIQKSNERGLTDAGWLKSYHSFSFGSYFDPKNMGFGNLKVFNDDWIDAGEGFPAHPHKDMEIISIVEVGELAHEDSTGSSAKLKAGEIQIMSAGSGITHSEFNASSNNSGKFFQIWIAPSKKGLMPRHEKQKLSLEKNKLILAVSTDGSENSLVIHQEAKVYLGTFDKGKKKEIDISKSKKHFFFVVEGGVTVDGNKLSKRDTAYLEEEGKYAIEFVENSQIILIEV